jgi:two-component system LytT family response regulator
MTTRHDPIRVLVADDEPIARRRVRDLLSGMPAVTLVAECANGLSALDAVTATRPDVVLLDIQMPGRDGLSLAELLLAREEGLPVVVFITAHAEHALRAFDVRAADYLLKPFHADRLATALDRARELVRARRADRLAVLRATVRDELRELLGDQAPAAATVDRFAVTIGRRTVFVRTETIERVIAEGNYVRLHTPRESYLLRASMADMERSLDPRAFARIHRSAIVRLACVRELRPTPSGETVAVLESGAEVAVSARYRKVFDAHDE